jgi:hypothetical protein
MKFRNLRNDEIEVRLQSITSTNKLILLLYKDARCDMRILDETVGALNWKREHSRDNANCTVSIWDETKGQWVGKEDTGVESNTEKEKGLASDSFKRACFNWGIGRELYTSPFICINAESNEIKTEGSRKKIYTKFFVSGIRTENDQIVALEISDDKKVRFSQGKVSEKKSLAEQLWVDLQKIAGSVDKAKELFAKHSAGKKLADLSEEEIRDIQIKIMEV